MSCHRRLDEGSVFSHYIRGSRQKCSELRNTPSFGFWNKCTVPLVQLSRHNAENVKAALGVRNNFEQYHLLIYERDLAIKSDTGNGRYEGMALIRWQHHEQLARSKSMEEASRSNNALMSNAERHQNKILHAQRRLKNNQCNHLKISSCQLE
jgi:hypothetical protein